MTESVHDEPVVKVACVLPVTQQMLDDVSPIRPYLDEQFDRFLNPWKYPDRYRWPELDLFPRWTRLVERFRRHNQP